MKILFSIISTFCLLSIVVGIVTYMNIANNPIRTNDSEYSQEYSKVLQYLVSVQTTDARGTGFKVVDGGKAYLYTCFHCIIDNTPIVAIDSENKTLDLGRLEMCHGRDLVRFELYNETNGLEIAQGNDVRIGEVVTAYGDALGGGVMTQNRGKILAIGNNKIEIDSSVVQGNSGGPVLDSRGCVIGVVSSGNIDNSVWAKDTRYEKVRRFAERVDNVEWHLSSYDDFREYYAFLNDTIVVLSEIRLFLQEFNVVSFINKLCSTHRNYSYIRYCIERRNRPFEGSKFYKGQFGYNEQIQKMYDKWNQIIDEHEYAYNHIVNYSVDKKCISLFSEAVYYIPLETLRFSLEKLMLHAEPYFNVANGKLINEINDDLWPLLCNIKEAIDKVSE